MPDFPTERFRGADATDSELEQLQAQWERSDLSAQQSLSDSWASMSEGGLRDHLALLREAGVLGTEVELEVELATATATTTVVTDPVNISVTPPGE